MKHLFTLIFILTMTETISQDAGLYRVYKVVKGDYLPDINWFEGDTTKVDFDIKIDGNWIHIYDEPVKVIYISKTNDDFGDDKVIIRSFKGYDPYDHETNRYTIYIGFNRLRNETSIVLMEGFSQYARVSKRKMTQYYYRKKELHLPK